MAALADELQQARLQPGILLGQLQVIGLPRLLEVSGDVWMQDAISRHDAPLDLDRLCRWQSALFPGGTSGLQRITVGRLRDHEDPMQIVSGRPGREVVHYTAPPSAQVGSEMEAFMAWFEASRPGNAPPDNETPLNGIVRAALAQDAGSSLHLFGLSSVLLSSRRAYHDALNAAQCGTLDVTPWILWFVRVYTQACQPSQRIVQQGIAKSAFWQRATEQSINERQRKILARLVEAGDGGFLGDMTADKYAKITRASKATTTRDLADLLTKALLVVEGVGKATRYAVNVEGWNQ